MKKKLLSLVLAGAMVASTSVSAFAATADKVIQDVDTTEPTTNITIMGQVLNEQDQAPEGRFHVTVPTTTSFTVNKEKKLVSPNITITNGGTQKVDVYAHEFTDSTANGNISVLGENGLENVNRTNVSLNIHGNRGTAYLGSNSGDNRNGIYSDKDLNTNVQKSAGVLLSTIQSNDSDNLVLDGKVGQQEGRIDAAVSDNFTLVLKIKKNNDK